MAPGLRLGWMVLPPVVREASLRIKQALDLHTSALTQDVAAHYLASERLAEHVRRVRGDYRARCAVLAEALREAFGAAIEFSEPEGGMFLWARLRSGIDTRQLLERARRRGVIFVPGDTFYTEQPDRATLRLNFTAGTPAQLREGVARLYAAYEELMDTPTDRAHQDQSLGSNSAIARG
jgi:DNA-binding transcriptional MocR family regulator